MHSVLVTLLSITALLAPFGARAADVLPVDTASKILLKVLLYDTRLASKGVSEVKIAVVGSDADVASFAKLKGQKIDAAKPFVVADVSKVSLPPATTPDMVFVSAGGDAAAVAAYTRSAKVMSTTNDPSLVPNGVAVGVGIEGGKPKVVVNLTASDSEGIKWDPAVLKVAETIK